MILISHMCLSELILMPQPECPSTQKALLKCLPGVWSADDLRKHAPARHRFPLPVGRPTGERIAIKECSPAERLDDPVIGLVTMSGGVDRQTLELLDRDG